MLRVLDLFSGIGGFSLGLERTGGFQTVAFCEIEPFPRRVLAKHWPEVPCYDDVRTLTAERLAADGIAVDVICGGFPCQDISFAGKGAGLDGERSGLFFEIARLVGELAPRYIILENVAALLSRGLADVLGTLASLGYDAQWHCIPASAVGAHHRRDRIWIVAYPGGEQHEGYGDALWRALAEGLHEAYLANTSGERGGEAGGFRCDEPAQWPAGCGQALADAECHRVSIGRGTGEAGEAGEGSGRVCRDVKSRRELKAGTVLADSVGQYEQGVVTCQLDPQGWPRPVSGSPGPRRDGFGIWAIEPDVVRVAHGVPDRAHRLKGLGNAVVPQIPDLIGRAIIRCEAA